MPHLPALVFGLVLGLAGRSYNTSNQASVNQLSFAFIVITLHCIFAVANISRCLSISRGLKQVHQQPFSPVLGCYLQPSLSILVLFIHNSQMLLSLQQPVAIKCLICSGMTYDVCPLINVISTHETSRIQETPGAVTTTRLLASPAT